MVSLLTINKMGSGSTILRLQRQELMLMKSIENY